MKEQMAKKVKQGIYDYQMDEISDIVREALAEGLTPSEITDVLIEAIRDIGEGFEKGDMFLPDMIGAADTMQNALPVLQEAYETSGTSRESLGVAVIGTVAGDIHTIGKGMVTAMLVAEGFDVHDIGIDIPTEKFVAVVKQLKPDVLAMSALLSSTAPEAQKVIEALKKEGIRDSVKIIVGGGAVTEAFANAIGADGYDDTAPGAAVVARKLLGK